MFTTIGWYFKASFIVIIPYSSFLPNSSYFFKFLRKIFKIFQWISRFHKSSGWWWSWSGTLWMCTQCHCWNRLHFYDSDWTPFHLLSVSSPRSALTRRYRQNANWGGGIVLLAVSWSVLQYIGMWGAGISEKSADLSFPDHVDVV